MSSNKLLQKQIKLAGVGVIFILLLGLASYLSPVQTQRAESNNRVAHAENLANQTFPDNGAPTGRGEGGASR